MKAPRNGFTLIEISIVLVIIGLVAGSVMVGRDMIKAATIRGTMAQVEKYNTAVNTFKGKYGFLPGDIPPATASAFGLFAFTGASAGTAGFGDGDGFIEGTCNQESLVFWRHLSDAGLIEGGYGQTLAANGDVPAAALPDGFLPKAKTGAAAYFVAQNYPLGGTPQGKNYLALITPVLTPGVPCVPVALQTVPADTAYSIDTKMDDGIPSSGRVIAAGDWFPLQAPGLCLSGGATPLAQNNHYDMGAGGDEPSCSMSFAFN